MCKKALFLILLGVMMPLSAAAGKMPADREETDEEKALFTGVKFQHGSTTLVDGTELGIDPSAPYGGGLEAEELAQFERRVVSVSDAHGTFEWSERTRKAESSAEASSR